jgi:hypothetical protein
MVVADDPAHFAQPGRLPSGLASQEKPGAVCEESSSVLFILADSEIRTIGLTAL